MGRAKSQREQTWVIHTSTVIFQVRASRDWLWLTGSVFKLCGYWVNHWLHLETPQKWRYKLLLNRAILTSAGASFGSFWSVKRWQWCLSRFEKGQLWKKETTVSAGSPKPAIQWDHLRNTATIAIGTAPRTPDHAGRRVLCSGISQLKTPLKNGFAGFKKICNIIYIMQTWTWIYCLHSPPKVCCTIRAMSLWAMRKQQTNIWEVNQRPRIVYTSNKIDQENPKDSYGPTSAILLKSL